MDTVKIPAGIKMIAHRGVSGIECENTCPAFLFAATRSYYGIETDVHLTRDGKYIICHDDNISRVAGGVDMVIEENDYETLRRVPLVSPRLGERRCDLLLPSLAEYIAICKKYEKRAILEIKNTFDLPATAGMLAVIREAGYEENVTFISFSRDSLVHLRALYPQADAQFLTCDATPDTLAFLDENGFDLDIRFSSLTPEFAEAVHAHGHKINVWTVDTPADAEVMRLLGVDFITSNILE